MITLFAEEFSPLVDFLFLSAVTMFISSSFLLGATIITKLEFFYPFFKIQKIGNYIHGQS